MNMTGKERVLCTLAHREPDRVPVTEFLYSRPLYREVLGYCPPYYRAQEVLRCAHLLGCDLAVIPFGGFGGFAQANGDTYRDEWGTLYAKQDTTWPVDAPVGFEVQTPQDFKNFTFPDPDLPQRLTEIAQGVQLAKEYNMAVAGSLRGPFSAAWLMLGLENFCMLLYDDPAFLHNVLAACTDFFVRGGQRMLEQGVDALVIADDYGSSTGPLLALPQYRVHIFPHLRRMVETLTRQGGRVILHSDGHIQPLLEDLAAMPFVGLHPMERGAGMDLAQVKAAYGSRLTLLGNVDNKHLLVTGSPHQVRAQVRQCIDIAAASGGYILASDHSVHDDIPNANVFAMIDEAKSYGVYADIRRRQ